MDRSADTSISLEVFHLYGIWGRAIREFALDTGRDDRDRDRAVQEQLEGLAVHSARLSSKWLSPYIDRFGSRLHTCFLLDDYFQHGLSLDALPAEVATKALVEAFADIGIRLHSVVSEAALANSASDLVESLAPRRPISGESAAFAESLWVSNDEPPRPEASGADQRRRPAARGFSTGEAEPDDDFSDRAQQYFPSRRQHSVRVDVEVESTGDRGRKPYSCAVLAAWWQMLRLGVLPARALEEVMEPAFLHRDANAPPFACDWSLSLVPSDLIDVEVAVRAIIESLSVLPVAWRKRRGRLEAPEFRQDVLERIAYLFVPDGEAWGT